MCKFRYLLFFFFGELGGWVFWMGFEDIFCLNGIFCFPPLKCVGFEMLVCSNFLRKSEDCEPENFGDFAIPWLGQCACGCLRFLLIYLCLTTKSERRCNLWLCHLFGQSQFSFRRDFYITFQFCLCNGTL